ncbi:MAG TPA: hypothetical protein K8V30_09605 [Metalysinibacillus jejuensis]|uniref:Uncharacterized protein n=1 Tax=Metalysinibacillus jejuensis TaxID=914327 RepID=A0A921NCD2_9BACL|nr:hypothetical protein [Metalysinibacillus jejuensis]HJH11922.1 hypothetical protein [Metalysinibacillus jejuensis]
MISLHETVSTAKRKKYIKQLKTLQTEVDELSGTLKRLKSDIQRALRDIHK